MRVQDEPRLISERIIATIADEDGSDPTEMSPPVYESVDLEALDSLFSLDEKEKSYDGLHRISFTYCSYRVCVDSTGEVSVTSI